MLSLDKRNATLAHVSFYKEHHGEDVVQGVALKITFDAPNSILDEFSPGLRKALYRAPEAKDAQQLFEEPEHFPLRRWPLMPTLKWDLAMIGREVVIDYGIGDDSAVRFIEATADKFSFDLREGGSVGVTFRVKATPDATQVAHLFSLIGSDISIAIAIGNGEQHSIEGGAGEGDPDEQGADRGDQVFAGALDGGSDDPFGSGEDEQ